ncbi:class I SAM-dependent methyltransferase [Patescibacteria group bacterium]|nr:class I SAM-dependent methyltransferase [Patescibacteria group bacterium]
MKKKIASVKKIEQSQDFYDIERMPEAAYPGTHNSILKILEKCSPGQLLDIGGGTGHFAKAVSKMWRRKVYVTELKRDYITESGLVVSEVNSDCDPLPYPDNFFDYVTFIEVIEHLKNPWFAIEEISRVLKPKGKLILTTPNIHNLRSKRHFIFKNKFPQFELETHPNPYKHLHPFTLTELKLILNENNFFIENISYGEGYRQRVPWSFYKKFRKSRPVWRNLAGYVIRNLLYLISKLVSFLFYGSFSTKNIFFAVTTILIASKKYAK